MNELIEFEMSEDLKQFKGTEKKFYQYFYGFLNNYKSDHTKKAYSKDLKKFFSFLGKNFKDVAILDVEQFHAVAFRNYLEKYDKSRNSRRTINRVISCNSAFYKHLQYQGMMEKNPFELVKRYRINRDVQTNPLEMDEVKEILAKIDTSNYTGALHKAILTVLFETGMRSGELRKLKVSNLVRCRDEYQLKYIGKYDKESVKVLSRETVGDIGNYLELRTNDHNLSEDSYLFSSREGDSKKLCQSSIRYMFKKYFGHIEGINITPHISRATAISNYVQNNKNLLAIVNYGGHSDINLTLKYAIKS